MSDETEEKGGAWETLKDAFKLAGDDEKGEKDDESGEEESAGDEDTSESEDGASGESDDGSEELSEEEVENPDQADDPYEAARIKVEKLEDNPPADISDWPDDQAKYETFGGADTEAYDEGATVNLGPPALRRFPDGSIEIEGEKVDNPEDYKGPPIKGGPTDPAVDASEVDTEKDTKVDEEGNPENDDSDEGEDSSESGDDSSEEAEASDDTRESSGGGESSGQSQSSGEAESSEEAEPSDGEPSSEGTEASGEELREQEQTSQ